jgi:citrate lyase beta subunit
MLLYQYLSLNNEVSTICSTLERNHKAGVKTVLDLEDSLEIPGAPERSAQSRVMAREKLANQVVQKSLMPSMGVRINHVSSSDFALDVECLQQLNGHIDHLIIPKVNSAAELVAYHQALKTVRCKELIILLETIDGFQQLEEILETANRLHINKIQFGHWDYFLSSNTYPIPGHDEAAFWEVASPLIQLLNQKGFTYIHSPFNRVTDYQLFADIIHHIRQQCKAEFGMAALTNGQVRHALKKNINYRPLIIQSTEILDKLAHAQNLVEQFKVNRYSFNISSNQVFIAPHEYWAAEKFLAKWSNS